MSGIYENNVVVLHNLNAFGFDRSAEPKYEAVYAFSDPRCDEWTEADLGKVFAICNGAPGGSVWAHDHTEAYYGKQVRSLSVSDAVFLNGRYYRCDSYGWSDLGSTLDKSD